MSALRIIYNSIFIPEELIIAAGAEPYPLYLHMKHNPEQEQTDALRFMDPYNRSILDTVIRMKSEAGGNDRIVMAAYNSHSMRMIEMLRERGCEVFVVNVPPLNNEERSLSFYINELEKLEAYLEKLCGKAVTPIKCAAEAVKNRLDKAVCDNAFQNQKGADVVLVSEVLTAADKKLLQLINDCGLSVNAIISDEGDEALKRIFRKDIISVCDSAEVRYLRKCTPTIFPGYVDKKYEYLKAVVADNKSKGILCLQLCFDELADIEYELIAKRANADGIPILRIELSYEDSEEEYASMATRLESYAMMLELL